MTDETRMWAAKERVECWVVPENLSRTRSLVWSQFFVSTIHSRKQQKKSSSHLHKRPGMTSSHKPRRSFSHQSSSLRTATTGSTTSLDLYSHSATHLGGPAVERDPYAHRPLHHQTRLSKPPTTGPQSSLNPFAPFTKTHSNTRSMPADLSNFFGNVKRSFSLNNSKKNDAPSSSTVSVERLAKSGGG
jgi:hypothetical protein